MIWGLKETHTYSQHTPKQPPSHLPTLPGKGRIHTLLASEPLLHEQVKCFTEELDKGHFDVEQKKTEEYHVLLWLAEETRRYPHRTLLK